MYVYMLTNTTNGKIYIGQTTKEPNERFARHIRYSKREADRKRMPIAHAIYKYGWENFTKCVLEVCETKEQLNISEIYWIARYNCVAPVGYNLRAGGDGCGPMHELTKQKLSELGKCRTHSDETKRKISESNSGRALSEEHRNRISQSMKGKAPSFVPSGSNSRIAKLTIDSVRKIRERYSTEKITLAKLGEEYGVSHGCIHSIVTNRTWK